MPRADAFKVEGLIVEVLSARTYRVELPNGHRLLGYVPGKASSRIGKRAIGESVTLELSPYDLSEGRITGLAARSD